MTLMIDNIPITTGYKREIRRCFHSGAMHDHFCAKNKIPSGTLDFADFDAFSATLRPLSFERKTTFFKYVHGWLPAHEQQNVINNTNFRCSCGENASYAKIKSHFLKNLATKMGKHHTHKDLHRLIMHLATYGEEQEYKARVNEEYYVQLREAYRQQKNIIITMIWRGIICQKMGDIQESTYRRWKMGNERNGTVW